ncbi:MAG TPA: hypothetical protein VNI57_15055, partial [Candidatus Saccharimonadales bacterium]|nr:hypothetical protein [Candidatus Saccharimonadales bacterium]
LFYYVPISTRHTVEVFHLRPLGDWAVRPPFALAGFYAGILAALFGFYLMAYRETGRLAGGERRAARGAVYAGTAAVILVLLFLPSLLSKDVFDYMVQGRILVLHRANPFQISGSAFGSDAFVRAMGWPQYTTLYGPGWVSACALLSWLAPGNLAGSLLVYKAVFAAVHLANGLIIAALLRGWGRDPLGGEILYLWNPLVILEVVGQGHNDGFLMLWALLGLLLIQRRESIRTFYDESLGTVCMTISILIKYVTGPLLVFLLAARWRERGGVRGLVRAIGLAFVALGVALVGYMPYASGMDFFNFLRPYNHGSYQGGTLMLLNMVLHKFMGETGLGGERAGDIMLLTGTVLALLTLALALLLAFRTRNEQDVARNGLIVLFGYILVVTALLRVSYGVWIVSLAVLVAPGLLRRSALIFSASVMTLDIFWVFAIRSMGSGAPVYREQALSAVVAVGVPISYLLAGVARKKAWIKAAGGQE